MNPGSSSSASFHQSQSTAGSQQPIQGSSRPQSQQAGYGKSSRGFPSRPNPSTTGTRQAPVRGHSLFDGWQASNHGPSTEEQRIHQDLQTYSQQLGLAGATPVSTSSDYSETAFASAPFSSHPFDWQGQTVSHTPAYTTGLPPSPFLINSQNANQSLAPLSIPKTPATANNPFSPVTPAVSKAKTDEIIADPAIPDSDPFNYPWNLLDITQTSSVPVAHSDFGRSAHSFYTPSYGSRSSFSGSEHGASREQFQNSLNQAEFQNLWTNNNNHSVFNDALSVYSDAMSRQPSPAPSFHSAQGSSSSPLTDHLAFDGNMSSLFGSQRGPTLRPEGPAPEGQPTLLAQATKTQRKNRQRGNFLGSNISVSPSASPKSQHADPPNLSYDSSFVNEDALESPAFTVASHGSSSKNSLAKLEIPNEGPSIEIECATATAGPATARPGQHNVLDRMIAEAQQQRDMHATSQAEANSTAQSQQPPLQQQQEYDTDTIFLDTPAANLPRRGRSHSETDINLLFQQAGPNFGSADNIQSNNQSNQQWVLPNGIDPRLFVSQSDQRASPPSAVRAAIDNSFGLDSLVGPRRPSHSHPRGHFPYDTSVAQSPLPVSSAMPEASSNDMSRTKSSDKAYGHRPTQSEGSFLLHPNIHQQQQFNAYAAPRLLPQGLDTMSGQSSPAMQSVFGNLSDQMSPAVPTFNSDGCPSPAVSALSYDTQSVYDQQHQQQPMFDQAQITYDPNTMYEPLTDSSETYPVYDDGTDISDQPLHHLSQTTKATKDAAAARRKAGTEAKYVCEYCGETFTRNYNLRGHLRAHNGSKPFACTEPGCDKAFARAHDLKRHSALHTSISKYKCLSCERSFKRLDALQRHHRSEAGQNCVAKLLAEGIMNPKQNGLVRVTNPGGIHL